MLNMFQMLIQTPSGACDLFHGLYCSGSMCVGVTLWFDCGGVVSVCRLKPAYGYGDLYVGLRLILQLIVWKSRDYTNSIQLSQNVCVCVCVFFFFVTTVMLTLMFTARNCSIIWIAVYCPKKALHSGITKFVVYVIRTVSQNWVNLTLIVCVSVTLNLWQNTLFVTQHLMLF